MKKGTREIALEILSFFDKNGYIPSKKVEIALSTLSFEERKFTVNLYMGALRKQVFIDHILKKYLKRPDKLPAAVRNALRLGVFQIYFVDSVPEYAAIKETVSLVGVKSFKNLVNAVLRRIANERIEFDFLPLWLRHSHPEWLVSYFKALPYLDDLEPLLEYNQAPPLETYLIDEMKRAELEENSYFFTDSEFSDVAILVERGIGKPELHRVDEMEYILEKTGEKVLRKSGSMLSLLNEKPWLFRTLKRDDFSKATESLLSELANCEHKVFFLLLDSYSLEETRGLMHRLIKRGYSPEGFDVTFGGRLKGKEQDYGVYYFPPDAPRPCFVSYLRRR
ncbi:transcription antitermination factor NusB [Kosmotoga pacifica]|uniref:NusB/RsmB/TIM44 domain-containing protein n=1 Tax=Kosmotoga pacifica TaxID=1330330 RepID=A0A0G2Z8F2_9BACT|nr:transcription antitermination factor NusB [Kosmotoga pacifica]AKI97847.1 hypothetical protein IX53_08525 [Kosmotoga pacifica]